MERKRAMTNRANRRRVTKLAPDFILGDRDFIVCELKNEKNNGTDVAYIHGQIYTIRKHYKMLNDLISDNNNKVIYVTDNHLWWGHYAELTPYFVSTAKTVETAKTKIVQTRKGPKTIKQKLTNREKGRAKEISKGGKQKLYKKVIVVRQPYFHGKHSKGTNPAIPAFQGEGLRKKSRKVFHQSNRTYMRNALAKMDIPAIENNKW